MQVYLGWRQSSFEVVDVPAAAHGLVFSDVCARLVARLQLPASIVKSYGLVICERRHHLTVKRQALGLGGDPGHGRQRRHFPRFSNASNLVLCPSPATQVMPTLAQLRVCFPTLDLVLAFVVLPRDVLVCVHSFPYPVGVRGSVFRRGSSVDSASSDHSGSALVRSPVGVSGGTPLPASPLVAPVAPPSIGVEEPPRVQLPPAAAPSNTSGSGQLSTAQASARLRQKTVVLTRHVQQLGLMFGNLQKAKPDSRTWQDLWVVLLPESLCYWAASASVDQTEPRCIVFDDVVACSPLGDRCLELFCTERVHTFRAEHRLDMLRWVTAISKRLTFISENDLMAMADVQMSVASVRNSQADTSALLSASALVDALHVAVLREAVFDHARTTGHSPLCWFWVHVRVFQLCHPSLLVPRDGQDALALPPACAAVLLTHATRIFHRFLAVDAPDLLPHVERFREEILLELPKVPPSLFDRPLALVLAALDSECFTPLSRTPEYRSVVLTCPEARRRRYSRLRTLVGHGVGVVDEPRPLGVEDLSMAPVTFGRSTLSPEVSVELTKSYSGVMDSPGASGRSRGRSRAAGTPGVSLSGVGFFSGAGGSGAGAAGAAGGADGPSRGPGLLWCCSGVALLEGRSDLVAGWAVFSVQDVFRTTTAEVALPKAVVMEFAAATSMAGQQFVANSPSWLWPEMWGSEEAEWASREELWQLRDCTALATLVVMEYEAEVTAQVRDATIVRCAHVAARYRAVATNGSTGVADGCSEGEHPGSTGVYHRLAAAALSGVPSWAAVPLEDLVQDSATAQFFLPAGRRKDHPDAGPALEDLLCSPVGSWRGDTPEGGQQVRPGSAGCMATKDTGDVEAAAEALVRDRSDRPTLYQVFDTSAVDEGGLRCAAITGVPVSLLASQAGETGGFHGSSVAEVAVVVDTGPGAPPPASRTLPGTLGEGAALGAFGATVTGGTRGSDDEQVDGCAHPKLQLVSCRGGWLRVLWRDALLPWRLGESASLPPGSIDRLSNNSAGSTLVLGTGGVSGGAGTNAPGRSSPCGVVSGGSGAGGDVSSPAGEWLLEALRSRLGNSGWVRAFGVLCPDGTLRLGSVPLSLDQACRGVGVWGGVNVADSIEVCPPKVPGEPLHCSEVVTSLGVLVVVSEAAEDSVPWVNSLVLARPNREFADGEVVMEGILGKKGRFNRGWKTRLFRLLAARGGGAQLVYYEPSGFLSLGKVELRQTGSVVLTPGKLLAVVAVDRMPNPVSNDGTSVFPFNVVTPSRTWNLFSLTPENALQWIMNIRRFLLTRLQAAVEHT